MRGDSGRPRSGGLSVKLDWPEDVPITEAEIEVFKAWFGDLFDELFATRHRQRAASAGRAERRG